MVVADKPNGAVRVCLDPRLLNKFIRREEFQIPDFDALASELTEAKVYSTIDLLSGFWQFGLDEESKKLLTFATPYSRYQYNRLPFGLSCAPEMFHKRVVETLVGIPGVLVYIDDILIWGATQAEHDERLQAVLQRLKDQEFSVNPKKCHYSQTKVKFLGHMIEDGQLSVDPDKVKAIRNMPFPEDRKGLKRVIGMLSFIRKFVPDYNALTAPFRNLLKERTPYVWTANEEVAMERIRSSEAWIKALSLFQPGKKLTLMADASSFGLWAVLLQEGRPVYFCSRTMTSAEESWAQIDKEFLALIWALERLDLFTYGQRVEVLTDHRPLLGLVGKPMDHCSIRQQRMLGRMMRYDVDLKFVPGKEMLLADTLSRAPVEPPSDECTAPFMGTDIRNNEVLVSECTTQESANEFMYTENSDRAREKLLQAAKNCEEYRETIRSWYDGWNPASGNSCGEYWAVRDHLFESEGLLYFQGKVVVPRDLRQKYLRAIHCGHVGIATCEKRATGVWWPGMKGEIRSFVKGCGKCQQHRNRQQKEPMQSFEIPNAPGLVIASDHFFMDGRTYVLFTDTFSMWTEFFRVQSTNANHLIRALRQYMSRNGIPRVLTADQGSAFTSKELEEFAEEMDMKIRFGSAKYSQGNAHAEAAVKRVKKWLRRCSSENDLCKAILAWHQTPVAQGRPSPAEIHLGRNVRDGLSWKVEQSMVEWDDVRKWREDRNREAKRFYDHGARKLGDLDQGELVWVWNGIDKIWEEGKIVSKLDRPRSFEVELKNGSRIERNRRDLKRDLTWHSKNESGSNLDAFQECPADRYGRTAQHRNYRAPAVRRRCRDDGGAGGGVAESDAGDGARADGGTNRARDQPVRGHSDAAAAAVPRGAPGSDRVDEPTEECEVDTNEQNPDQECEGKPRRDRRKPKKYDDYVLY
jgi:hypothetical protein